LQDKDKTRSIIFEIIANQSLWIWHTFFSLLRGNNHVNVLDKSPFVAELLKSEEVGYVLSTLLFVGIWNLPPLELFRANHT